MTITTKENANGRISAYFVDGVKVRKNEIAEIVRKYYYSNRRDEIIEVDYMPLQQLKIFTRCPFRLKLVATNFFGETLMTIPAAEFLGKKLGDYVMYDLYKIATAANEVDREYAMLEVAVAPEAQDAAIYEEEKNALDKFLTDKYGEDWAIKRTKALKSMFSKKAEPSTRRDEVLAELKADGYKFVVTTNKIVDENNSTTILPTETYVKTHEKALAELKLQAKFYAANPAHDGGFELATLDGELLAKGDKIADYEQNLNAKSADAYEKAMLETVITKEAMMEAVEGEKELATAELFRDAGELLRAHREYFRGCGTWWEPVYCHYDNKPELDGSEEDDDETLSVNVLPIEQDDTDDELVDEREDVEALNDEYDDIWHQWQRACTFHDNLAKELNELEPTRENLARYETLPKRIALVNQRIGELYRKWRVLEKYILRYETRRTVGDDDLTFAHGKVYRIYSNKYGAAIEFRNDGSKRFFTNPLKDDGTIDYLKDESYRNEKQFFEILAERGAITFYVDNSAAHIAKQYHDLQMLVIGNAAAYGINEAQTEKLFIAQTLGATQDELIKISEEFLNANAPEQAESEPAAETEDDFATKLAELKDKIAREVKPCDDNNEVFNLLPAIDDLNDVDENAVAQVKIDNTQSQDEFHAELAKLKNAADEAYMTFIKAQEAHEHAKNALKNFLDDTAFKLKQKLDALPLNYTITLKKASGCTYRVPDFSEIYIGAYHIGCDVEFRFEDWRGKIIARYETPAQVETVINRLREAIEHGDEEFTFPTVEELNKPAVAEPEIPPSKNNLHDSLARAMKINLEKIQEFCRAKDLKAAQNEMERYQICSQALRESCAGGANQFDLTDDIKEKEPRPIIA